MYRIAAWTETRNKLQEEDVTKAFAVISVAVMLLGALITYIIKDMGLYS